MFDYVAEGNMTIFDFMYPTAHIGKNKIRLIELFGGIGSQAMALRNIGADFEHYKLVEYDKYPVMSYNAIHGTDFKPTDIREVHGEDLGIKDTDNFTYITTYSFPCQDLSVAGKMKGMSKGSGTRSGLLWEVERLLNETENLPQVLLMENVPQVISDANIADFHLWQKFLEEKGYTNYVDVLNAKDYGVAQNRERCFMVSLLGQWNYKFPQPIPLTKTMADYLEDEVDEKYYINSEKAMKLISELMESGQLQKTQEVSYCLDANYWRGTTVENFVDKHRRQLVVEGEVKQIGNLIEGGNFDNPQRGRVYSSNGISPAIYAFQGGNLEHKILEIGSINSSKDGIVLSPDGISKTLTSGHNNQPKILKPVIVASRGRNPQNPSNRTPGADTEQRLEPNSEGICNTLTSVQKDNLVLEKSYIGGIYTDVSERFQRGVLKGVSRCLKANEHDAGVLETVKIKQATTDGYIECELGGVADLSFPSSATRRGRVQGKGQISPTLTATETGVCRIESPYRIRKLVPLETWRLMGFTDEDFHKAEKVNSNTQLYKQAGNSIVVNVLEAIFKQMM